MFRPSVQCFAFDFQPPVHLWRPRRFIQPDVGFSLPARRASETLGPWGTSFLPLPSRLFAFKVVFR